MPKFITVGKLAEKYNLEMKTVYVFVYKNKHENYVSYDGSTPMIDIEYLENRQEEANRLWLCPHDYYYFLLEKLKITEHKLAELISLDYPKHAWKPFINSSMWSRIDGHSIIASKVSHELLYKFVEWCEILIPTLNRRQKQ